MTSTTTPQKLRSLADLISEKTAVETSCGTLYVRSKRGNELWSWDDLGDEDMGRVVVQRLCGHVQDKNDLSGLQGQTIDKLNQLDIALLAQAFAKKHGWEECPKIEDFKALGLAFGVQCDKQDRAAQESILKSVEQSQRKVLESIKPFIPPRPEDSPMGRAMLQSAKELEQIKALALKADRGSAEAERIARKSLKIAFWTFVVAIVGVAVTAYPLLLPKSSGSETASVNTVQPSRVQASQDHPQAASTHVSKPSAAISETENTNTVHQPKTTPKIHNDRALPTELN